MQLDEAKCKKLLKKVQKEFNLNTEKDAAKQILQYWTSFDPVLVEYAELLVNPKPNQNLN